MDVIYILIYLTLVGSQSVEALECFDCADIDDIDDCLNTTHCSVGQSCYQDLKQTENSPRYTLGCTDNQVCGHLSNEFVGRDLTERQTQDCHECCSTANCNKHLCEHLKPSACIDDVNADCAWLNTIVNICEDIQHAKTVCAKFCGLCHLVDGNWADWSPWSTCDVTCQNGTQTRTRTCTNPAPAYGGLDCVGNSTDFKICYTGKLCPVHGGWSSWGQWESCPVTCGTGIETRHRSCSNPYPDRVGDHCFGEGIDVRLCMPGPCANGGWSGWGTWSSCSLTCGGGLKSRSRNCTNPRPSPAGRPCYGDPSHVTSCNSNPCPTPSVSFRSKDVTDTTPAVGARLIFGNVTLNEGNGYNRSTGIFSAPVAGTYLFTVHICINQTQEVGYALIADSNEIHREIVRYSDQHCAASDTVVNLRKSSNVYVKCIVAGRLYQSSDYFWNTFTGSLMHL